MQIKNGRKSPNLVKSHYKVLSPRRCFRGALQLSLLSPSTTLCKELTFRVSHKILNSLKTHVHALLILMSCLYHLLFFVFFIKEHEITKKRKKLDKNVIAKLSGNKVILLRKKCSRPLTFLYIISKECKNWSNLSMAIVN